MKQRLTTLNKNRKFQYFAITIAAIIFSLCIQVFILVAHTLTTGLSSIALIPSFIWENMGAFVTPLYLLLNIPLVIFYWKKVKRDFIFKTLYYLVIQASFGLLFYIDSIHEYLTNLIVNPDNVYRDVWPIFLLAGIGGIASGAAIGIAWKYGGSSGGSDIIAHHYSQKHKKSVGSSIFVFSMLFMFVSLAFNLAFNKDALNHWLSIIIATFIYMVISTIMVSIIHPKYSAVNVEVHSIHTDKITKHLKATKYIHSWQIMDGTSGYTGKSVKVLRTTMLLLELRAFKKTLFEIDPAAWVSITRVRSVFGKFDTRTVD